MPYSSGTYSLPALNPVVTATTISSTWANNTMNDVATALSTCVLKDGTQTLTANIPMSNFKLTGLGAGSARTDSAQLGQLQDSTLYYLSSVAGTNTVTGTVSPAITAYVTGQQFLLTPANTNTGATTLNINSVGGGAVQSHAQALAGGELIATVPVVVACVTTTPVFEMIGTAPFADSRPLVVGSVDPTKMARFEVDGLTTATTRVYTLQDSNDTMVGRATTDTLTNKTITGLLNTVGAGVLSAEVATTSGISVDITGIPTWVKHVVIMGVGVSSNGTSPYMIQLGDSGGIESSGYNGNESIGPTAWSTGGLMMAATVAAATYTFVFEMTLEHDVNDVWVCRGAIVRNDGTSAAGATFVGNKATSTALTQIRLTTAGGANTFDAGVMAISYF